MAAPVLRRIHQDWPLGEERIAGIVRPDRSNCMERTELRKLHTSTIRGPTHHARVLAEHKGLLHVPRRLRCVARSVHGRLAQSDNSRALGGACVGHGNAIMSINALELQWLNEVTRPQKHNV